MATLTIRMPDDKRERLKALAKRRGMSINKLMDELATVALTEYDARMWYEVRAANGDPQEGLSVLDELDRHFGTE